MARPVPGSTGAGIGVDRVNDRSIVAEIPRTHEGEQRTSATVEVVVVLLLRDLNAPFKGVRLPDLAHVVAKLVGVFGENAWACLSPWCAETDAIEFARQSFDLNAGH